jgi:hypothetical protein
MKSKTKVFPIVLFFSVIIMLVSCQKQKAKWKGTIEEVDGVTVAKIPLEFQPQAFKKSKLYTIEEDEEGYQYAKRYKVTWRY